MTENSYEKLAKLALNKSLLKEYSNSSNERIVYMKDDTEFQIQIFNPYEYIIGVSFLFNKNISYNNSQLLVLRPGERVWLDRYLDNESKLLFSTYEVNASKQVEEAIKNNGNIIIKFYKEKQQNSWYCYNITTVPDSNIKWYTLNDYDNYSGSISNINYSINNNDVTCTNIDASLNLNNTSCSIASASACSSLPQNYDIKVGTNSRIKSSIETGRIETGSHSNQKFQNVYKDFENWPFKIETIKILPESLKQLNSNDLQKRYCHNCGRKLNQKFKYCPYCGIIQ